MLDAEFRRLKVRIVSGDPLLESFERTWPLLVVLRIEQPRTQQN